jgi:membrane-bound ClpP family serine protease
VRHLRTISLLLTVLGIALVLAALLFDANPTVGLVGMMLVVAGAVKIVIVRLWQSAAGFGAPVPAESATSTLPRKE